MAAVVEQVTSTELRPALAGRNPWALAWRRLRRNRIALAALGLFVVILLLSLAAPLYAHDIAHDGNVLNPNLNGTTVAGGKVVPVMQQGGGLLKLGETPIGPTWNLQHYFLGADNIGRDVAALLLYGGRSSLQIGICSAVLCCLVATIVALIAGFFGGLTDAILSRLMDVIWAFPVYLLAISIATELLTHSNGVQVGFLHVSATSLWTPTMIIAFIYVPYVYRPVRGQVLSVVNKEFVEAAIAQGASNFRLIFSEILPNVVSTVIVHAAADDRDHDPDRSSAVLPVGRRTATKCQLGHDHLRRSGPAVQPSVGFPGTRDHDRADGTSAQRTRRRGA